MKRLLIAALFLAVGLMSRPVVNHALSARFQAPTHLADIYWLDKRPS